MGVGRDGGEDGNGEALLLKDERREDGESHIWVVGISTLVAVLGSYLFGSAVAYSSPTELGIMNDLGLTLAQYSVFGSMLSIGAMIGAAASGCIADFIGRKGAMRMSTVSCTVGWLFIYLCKGALALDIGRFFTGYGIGVFSYVVPVFIAEITPMNLRGGFTTVNQLMVCIGGSVTLIVGTIISWRTLAITGLVPCIVLLLGLFFIPESPRWLAKVGHQKEFEDALRRLRGKGADVSMEAAEIQDYVETLQNLPKARIQDLFQRKYARSVIVGIGLMVFQQFGGINGIASYMSVIFVSAGFSSGNIGTITVAFVQIPVTALGAILTDKTGRRPLLMISSAGTCLGCLLTGISFHLKGHEMLSGCAPVLALTGILVYFASFSIGMGAIPWVIMSEIFPMNVKGIAGSLVTLVNWLVAWVVTYTFNFLMSWSSSGTFFLYAGASAMNVLFVVKLVPETKGRTLEEIQTSMNS